MSIREQNRVKTEELVMELLVIRSILYKMEFDELADNESLFIAFVNNLDNPPTTANGNPLTYMGYRQMMQRFPAEKLRHMIEKISSEAPLFTVQ